MNVYFIRSKPIVNGPTYDRIPALLSQRGYNVIYLGWDRQKKYPKIEYNGLYKIIRFQYIVKNIISKFWGFIKFWIWSYILFLKYQPEVVHVCDTVVIPPALIYKLLFRKKVIFQMYDFLTAELNFKSVKIRNIVAKVEEFLISLSDVVICVSKAQKDYQLPNINNKTIIIPNSPTDFYKDYDFINKLSNDNKSELSIFYGGYIHKSRGLDFLCEAVCSKKFVNLKIAGDGPFYGNLKNKFKNCGNIKFYGEISHKKLLLLASQSDVLYACYFLKESNINMEIGNPNKYFESLMLGKPLITNLETNIGEKVNKHNTGFVIPFGDTDSLVKLFDSLISNPKILKVRGNNARELYEKKYNWDILEKKVLKIYQEIL